MKPIYDMLQQKEAALPDEVQQILIALDIENEIVLLSVDKKINVFKFFLEDDNVNKQINIIIANSYAVNEYCNTIIKLIKKYLVQKTLFQK